MWLMPAATATASVRPLPVETCVGEVWLEVEPVPSLPLPPLPHAQRVPSFFTAKLDAPYWSPLAEIATTSPKLEMTTGVWAAPVVVPRPS